MKNIKINIGKGYLRSKTHQKVKKSENMRRWKEADWIRRGNERSLQSRKHRDPSS